MSTPRRGKRNLSESVRHLHNTLTRLLSDNDRAFFIQVLNQYQRDRDVQELVSALKSVLDTPRKREVYPVLREIIPSRDRNYFDRYWQGNRAQIRPEGISSTRSRARRRSPHRSSPRLRRSQKSTSLPENLNKYDSGIDINNYRNGTTPRVQKYPIRKLQIKRRSPASGFGFCMRGGSEHGVGLYISSVDRNSVAEAEGLLPGDHILTINDLRFDGLSHEEAVKIIRANKKLNMLVRSVGRIPNTFVAEATYKWIDPYGRQIDAPPIVDSRGRSLSVEGIHKSDLRLLGDDDERKVNVFVEDSGTLGLKIRGGSDYGLGIYIAGVDAYSAADRAGLKCGDQIMDVNGTSFLNISHKNAIKILKTNKNMMMTIKDVGRLPYAKTMKDKTRWSKGQVPNTTPHNDKVLRTTITADIHSPPANSTNSRVKANDISHWGMHNVERPEKSKFQHGIAGSQLIYNGTGPSTKKLTAEQARQVLNENELGTMTYYMEEYSRGFISVDDFVLALFDLFDTPAKVSLLSEIRGAVLPKDIDRFDDLVLKREVEAMKARKSLFKSQADTHSNHSYHSSLSSCSGRGSISSRSSTKESFGDANSRPITPPRVPNILPPNIKIHDDLPYPPVPWAVQTPSDDNIDDSDTSLPPPPSNLDISEPLLASSPKSRDINGNHVTNGEVTTNEDVCDNTRVVSMVTASTNPGLNMLAPRKSHGRQRLSPSRRDSGASSINHVNGDFRKSLDASITEDADRTLKCNGEGNSPRDDQTNYHHRKKDSEKQISVPYTNTTERMNSANLKTQQSSPRNEGASGMMLAMETNATDRSGLERSTGWGEDAVPYMANPMYELCSPDVTVTQSSMTSDSVTRDTANHLAARRGSGANRKSWDGVRTPEEEEANLKISAVEQKKYLKSSSDSNLMNLPKNEQKNIQVKLKASQELYDLHQHSKHKSQDVLNNNYTRASPLDISHNSSVHEVYLEKSGVGLGLSIDGGSDTQSPVRVKHVKDGDYAAKNCGQLKPGQTILEINGQAVDGMTQGIATLTLRLAYSDPDTNSLHLVVADP